MQELDASAVAELLRGNDGTPDVAPPALLLDVREAWELDVAKVEGAFHMAMGSVPSRVAELDPTQPVIIMCHHGSRSRAVGQWLEAQGFADVSNFDGGIDAWSRLIDPSVPRY